MSAKAIFFDFMGTCLDWHTGIVQSFPHHLPEQDRSSLALEWRQAFFDDISSRFAAGLPPEDIDHTHRRTLDAILASHPTSVQDAFTPAVRATAVQAWHSMTAWPEVTTALQRVNQGYEIFVLANGTTRLQLDLTASSGLRFNMLFSSELMGLTKPAPAIYLKAMELVRARPADCVMVAAHAYDLRAARKVGMKTVYVRRWTEDPKEDMELIRKENDAFLEDLEHIRACIDALFRHHE